MLKILTIVPAVNGVSYHRQIIPHQYLKNNDADIECAQADSIDTMPDDILKDYQIVQFNKLISVFGNHEYTIDRLHKLGIKVVCDIDDYWEVPAHNPVHEYYQANGVTKQVLTCIKLADLVTTTQAFLAWKIKEHNLNVEIIPNAIDPDQPNYEIEKTESDCTRFGWIGSLSHAADVRMLEPAMERLNKLKADFKTCIMGYDENDDGFYKWVEQKFRKGEPEGADRFFRITSADVYTYAQGYNLFDVALAPLNRTIFNSCKSELKMIEAGFMKKAIIVSATMPYLPLISKHNCISINEKYPLDWYHGMKDLIYSRRKREDLAEQLYQDVQQFHIKIVNEKRKEIYKKLAE